MAVTVDRRSLRAARWDSADAATILNECARELVMREKGVTKALQPLDLAQNTDLERLVNVIDFDDLAGTRVREELGV